MSQDHRWYKKSRVTVRARRCSDSQVSGRSGQLSNDVYTFQCHALCVTVCGTAGPELCVQAQGRIKLRGGLGNCSRARRFPDPIQPKGRARPKQPSRQCHKPLSHQQSTLLSPHSRNGLGLRVCGGHCSCLPVPPSQIPTKHLREMGSL